MQPDIYPGSNPNNAEKDVADMVIEKLEGEFVICKLSRGQRYDTSGADIMFYSVTDSEVSLVTKREFVPKDVCSADGGWTAYRIKGTMEFSMTGVISRIAGVIAEQEISIFVISTYDTDYFLIKSENESRAEKALAAAGYKFDITLVR